MWLYTYSHIWVFCRPLLRQLSLITTRFCARNIAYPITWGWDINPLVPGWVPGQRKPDSQSVWFCLIPNLVFFCFVVPGWFLKSQIRPLKKIAYTSRFSTGKPNPCQISPEMQFCEHLRNCVVNAVFGLNDTSSTLILPIVDLTGSFSKVNTCWCGCILTATYEFSADHYFVNCLW